MRIWPSSGGATVGRRRQHGVRSALVLVPAAVGLFVGCGLTGGPPERTGPSTPPGRTASVTPAADLERLVNVAREDAGVEVLEHDDCAARVAAERAQALVGAQELTHGDLDDVLDECGVARAGENLARSERPPQEVVDAWLASPGHASNVRDQGFDRGAVACVQDGEAEKRPQMLCSHVFLESDDAD
ncbi:hypothetical protein ISCU110981_09840 [Isoptericola cucumis]